MDEHRFRALLDAYGGAPRRWPAQEREAAQAFAEAHTDRAPQDEAARLDAVLEAGAPECAPTAALMGRILQDAAAVSSARGARGGGWFGWAAPLGAALGAPLGGSIGAGGLALDRGAVGFAGLASATLLVGLAVGYGAGLIHAEAQLGAALAEVALEPVMLEMSVVG